MKLDRVDLNLFIVFDTIYSERNLTRAAEVLSVTQPAVSNALTRLRDVFDDQLFIRKPRGMEPTPVADNIIEPVRQALTLLNFSINEGAYFDPARTQKTFHLSMNDLSEMLLLPPMIQRLRELAPQVEVRSYYVAREELVKEFASGQVDIAIDVPLINHPDLLHQPISQEHYVCVLRPGHPLLTAGHKTKKRKPISLEDYLALEHVHVSSRRSGSGYVDMALSKLGHQRKLAVRVQHYMAAPEIISGSDMALTVPRALAKRLALPSVELPFELASLDWHMYWHKSADNDRANRWLREQLVASLGVIKASA